MKLSYLSLAVASALTMSLTACGSSDDDNTSYTVPATTAPAPTPTTTTPTTTTPTTTTPTTTTPTTTTPTTTTPTTTTPTTTTPTTTTTSPTTIDPTGSKAAIYDNIDLTTTPTVVGQNYIRNAGANFDYTANTNKANNASSIALGSIDLNTQNPNLTNIVVGYDGQKSTDGVTIKRFVGNIPNTGTNITSQQFNSKDINGTVVPQNVNLVSLQDANTTNAVQVATTGYTNDANGTSGLVSTSATTGSFNNTGVGVVVGSEETNNLSTRIFGKNYRDVANTGTNSYQYTTANATTDAPVGAALTPTAIQLQNVQYGRVSSNVDALDANQSLANFVVSDYRGKQANDAVSNYFYRGTNQTTTAQMAALPKDAVYTYLGHAVTYGLGNTGATASTNTPNSFGTGTTVDTLGNFVRADYTVATGGVAGTIYNAVKTTTNVGTSNATSSVTPNNLVSFTGNATGNTVIGTSTKLADNSAGLFRASFYGDKAQEMGGSVNSISSGYGTSSWGGVFGAQRQIAPVVAPVTTNTNGWLIQSPN